jgi:glycosyltransferase involved in cell wall biosynthesis
MIFRWSLLAMRKGQAPEVVVVGTDPILSVLVAIAWQFLKPKTLLANWCFDLYPEAAYADNLLNRRGVTARLLHPLLKKAYRACDLVVDIGPCMRELLLRYDPALRMATITPWALEEPTAPLPVPAGERAALFGNAPLGLLYSGTFGRAHSYQTIVDLARLLRLDGVCLTFSIRGNREEALRAAVLAEDSNIRFAGFTAPENLSDRLASADVHVVTLREEWTGTVVPSKFFGALAIGRPVLFCGDSGSAIAKWIREYELGWVLTPGNMAEVAASMRELLMNRAAVREIREHCHAIYQAHFSCEFALDRWDGEIRDLLKQRSTHVLVS